MGAEEIMEAKRNDSGLIKTKYTKPGINRNLTSRRSCYQFKNLFIVDSDARINIPRFYLPVFFSYQFILVTVRYM